MPLNNADATMLQAYELVTQKPGIRLEPVSWRILHHAAAFRASRPALRTPDAIHIATADQAGCQAFITNDKALRSVPLPNVIVLDDLR